MSSTYSRIVERRSPKSPVPRSPLLRSPMPKSPFPKSPMPQSPELYEKYKSKCVHGLVSFFHFRQSYSKKLISDKGQLKGQGVEMKKIMGEDVSIKQQQVKWTTAKVEHVQSDSEHVGDPSTNHRKAMKSSRRPRRLPIYGCYDVATMGHAKSVHDKLVDDSSKKLDSSVMGEALPNQQQPKDEIDRNCRSIDGGRDVQFKEINLQVRLNEVTEDFINQRLIDGKHLSANGANQQSKHFMDTLEILNSNKDLFIKLLQDPNSLLKKHIEDLRDSLENKPKLSEHLINNPREHKETVGSQNSNPSDSYQSKGMNDPQSLDTIVVLRPGSANLQNCADQISHDSPQVHYRLKNVQQSVKPSFFPFVKMKKKLMHAMGVSRKEQQLTLTDGAGPKSGYGFHEYEKYGRTDTDIDERNSPDETSCYFGRTTASSVDVKSEDQMETMVGEETASASDCSHESSKFSSLEHSSQNMNDKYVETRVHLSESLKNENVNLLRKQRPKIQDGLRSLPDDEFLPSVSPRCQAEHGRVTPQMRFSPYSSSETANRNNLRNQIEKKINSSPSQQNVEAPPWANDHSCGDQLLVTESKQSNSDIIFSEVQADESISSLENDLSSRGLPNIIGRRDNQISEVISPSRLSSKADCSHYCDAYVSTYAVNATAEYESLNILRLDSPAESRTSTSSRSDLLSSPLSIQRVEDLEKAKEAAEQPSPISVLEKFLVEDATSPSSSASRPAKLSVLPLQMGIEEEHLAVLVHSPLNLKINSSTSLEECGYVFEYIGAILEASGFNLNDLLLKCHSLCHNQSCGDHKLICDYFMELLLEVYQDYLRSSPWLSFINPKVRTVTMAANMVQQVTKFVDRKLLLRSPSQTLEQHVEKDLANPTPWLDVRIDAEDIISMTVESFLEELIMETAIE